MVVESNHLKWVDENVYAQPLKWLKKQFFFTHFFDSLSSDLQLVLFAGRVMRYLFNRIAHSSQL